MKTFKKGLVFYSLLVVFGSPSAFADLITNGDFEAGTLLPGTSTSSTGTTQFLDCTGLMSGVTTPGNFGTGGSGSYTAYFDGSTGTASYGGSTAACANFATFAQVDPSKSYNVTAHGTILNMIVSDFPVLEYTADSVADALLGDTVNMAVPTNLLTDICTLSGPLCTIQIAFAIVGDTTNYGWLDNVSLTEATPIPEPGTVALLSMGLLGLYATRRRQTKS